MAGARVIGEVTSMGGMECSRIRCDLYPVNEWGSRYPMRMTGICFVVLTALKTHTRWFSINIFHLTGLFRDAVEYHLKS